MEQLFTERAHLMCANMCFGMAMILPAVFEKQKITDSLETLAKAHPFCNAVLGHDEKGNAYFYDVKESSQIELIFGEGEIDSIESGEIINQYETFTNKDWDITKEGMLKVIAWKSKEGTCFLWIFHHLLADGRGALGLCQEFADLYVEGVMPKYAPEKLISSADFPKESEMPWISRLLIKQANQKWEKEGHKPLSYGEYHAYADRFVKEDPVKHELTIPQPIEYQEMVRECKEHSVSINDLLMARMYLEEKTNKIIIACDLRDQLKCYNEGALGNYSSAFSVTLKAKDQGEFELAAQVHEKVQAILKKPSDLYLVLQCYANMDPALLDAAFMASRGAYESKAAEFIGKSFFAMDSPKGYSITNLGRIESANIKSAYFIPPASPAIRKTQGVLTVNGQMILCTSRRKGSNDRAGKGKELPKYLFEAGADNGLIPAYQAYFALEGESLRLIKEKQYHALLREKQHELFQPGRYSIDVMTNDGDMRSWRYEQKHGEKYDLEKLFPIIEELGVERTKYFFVQVTEFDGYQLVYACNTEKDGHGLVLGHKQGVFKDGKRLEISPKIRIGSFRWFYRKKDIDF
ncbi:MAG: hypothetical protein J5546_09250 [Lachnospiraceae bacterium]|nr:hypothetical protein [Lachnospiraceae bacterium]